MSRSSRPTASSSEADHTPHADLRRRIAQARDRLPQDEAEQPRRRPSGSELGLRLVLDMAAALIAGLLLGWGMDHLLESAPWGMLLGALLGIGAGIRNVLHTASLVSPPSGARQPHPPGHDDGQDA